MRILRKISQGMMSAGLIGLVLSFTALLRDQWGVGLYLVGGLILLAVGAVAYWIASRNRPDDEGSRKVQPQPKTRWKQSNLLGFISLGVYLVVAIYVTVIVISDGKDGAILFLIWLLFVGDLMLLLARTFTVKSEEVD